MTSRTIALTLAAAAACALPRVTFGQQSPPTTAPATAPATGPSEAVVPEVTSTETRPMGPWGFDTAGMDKSVKPGDDFAGYTGGGWARHTAIPPDRSRYGAFDVLRELSDLRVRRLLEEMGHTATTMPAEATPEVADRVKLAALYASYLDTAECDRRDADPIRPMLDALKLVKTPRDVAAFMGHSEGTLAGGSSLFGAGVSADEKRPEFNTVYLGQSGLGLPDREYYLSPVYAKQKERYQQYVGQMLEMVGWADPTGSAAKVVAFETEVAKVHWSRAQSRDRERTYNPSTIAKLVADAPGFDWPAFFDAAGVGSTPQVIVSQDTAMPKLAKLASDTPPETMAAWQAYKIVDEAAPLLSKRFVDASFEFHGKFMSGAPQQRDRAKRAASFAEGVMGEALGREYVAKYFPPAARDKAEALVEDVKTAMRHRIEHVAWMSDQTRAKALAKMGKFGVKIGYPTKWRDYSQLIVDPTDLFGNAARAARFGYARSVSKLGQKVDKLEWGMTPQTVNAYYNPSRNEIVFPAAILQPPFFDANADPAVNYGGIGAVIGHEITHGFDDQGRKSDGDGVLADWWTPDDAAKFEAEAKKLGARYEALEFPNLPGSKINGKTTMGENIADLGGILCAIDAYHASLHGAPSPVIDGFTGDQRVFLGWAQVWRTLSRDAALKQQLATDPHSPGSVRAFAPLRNLDLWYTAFDVKPGEKQYLPPEQRVRIW